MSEQERPLMDRVWEFTKDISVKVSRKAEKHWKINTLRVEIASIRHRINVKYKELGRYVYESVKSQTLEEDSYKASLREFFDELKRLEGEILQRENRIEILEQEMRDASPAPPPFPGEASKDEMTAATEADVVDAEVVSETQSESETSSQEQETASPEEKDSKKTETTAEASSPEAEDAATSDTEEATATPKDTEKETSETEASESDQKQDPTSK